MRYGRIGRRVYKTICACEYYDDNNEKQEMEVELWGEYGIDRAEKHARQQAGNNRLAVRSVKVESFYASMPLETFVKNADVITA